MLVHKFILYCFAFQYLVVSKYTESVCVLWSIFSWPFALHGHTRMKYECDNKNLLSKSDTITFWYLVIALTLILSHHPHWWQLQNLKNYERFNLIFNHLPELCRKNMLPKIFEACQKNYNFPSTTFGNKWLL